MLAYESVLDKLILEILGRLLCGVIVVCVVGGIMIAWEWFCYLPWFEYRDIPKIKSLDLNRPIFVKKLFYDKMGIWYVYYEDTDYRDTLLIRLGGRWAKRLRPGYIFEVRKWGWWRYIYITSNKQDLVAEYFANR